MKPLMLTNVRIIVAGPTTGKSWLVKQFPNVFIDIEDLTREVDPNYYERKAELERGNAPRSEVKAKVPWPAKQVCDLALARVGKHQCLLSSKWTKEMPSLLPPSWLIGSKFPIIFWRGSAESVVSHSQSASRGKRIPLRLAQTWEKAYQKYGSSASYRNVVVPDGAYLANMFDLELGGERVFTHVELAPTHACASVGANGGGK